MIPIKKNEKEPSSRVAMREMIADVLTRYPSATFAFCADSDTMMKSSDLPTANIDRNDNIAVGNV